MLQPPRIEIGNWAFIAATLLAIFLLPRAMLDSTLENFGPDAETGESGAHFANALASGVRNDPTITVTLTNNFDEPLPDAELSVFATGGLYLGGFSTDAQGVGVITLDGERMRLTGSAAASVPPSVAQESYRIKATSGLIYEYALPGGGYDATPAHEPAVSIIGQAYVKDGYYQQENNLTQAELDEHVQAIEGSLQHSIKMMLVELEPPDTEGGSP